MHDIRTLARRRLAPVLSIAAALALAVSSPASAQPVAETTSANWAGYAVGGTTFSSVSGSWTVPAARSSTDGYSAFWVGLGGTSSESSGLEQVGTESDYVDGQARYYAWYELVPAAAVRLDLPIHSGDRIAAKVSVSGTRVTVSLSDLTTGRSVTKTLRSSDPDTSSAEWIAEAPAAEYADGTASQLPLADFGTASFTGATATAADGHTGSIVDSDWQAERIELPGATTSSPAGDGSSFRVSSAQRRSPYGYGPSPWSGGPGRPA